MPNVRRFRVTVIEWLSHKAIIEAADEIAAEDEARRLWAENIEYQAFSFEASGIDGIEIEEIPPH